MVLKSVRKVFTVYTKIAFNDPNLSKNIDNVLYGKRDKMILADSSFSCIFHEKTPNMTKQ